MCEVFSSHILFSLAAVTDLFGGLERTGGGTEKVWFSNLDRYIENKLIGKPTQYWLIIDEPGKRYLESLNFCQAVDDDM